MKNTQYSVTVNAGKVYSRSSVELQEDRLKVSVMGPKTMTEVEYSKIESIKVFKKSERVYIYLNEKVGLGKSRVFELDSHDHVKAFAEDLGSRVDFQKTIQKEKDASKRDTYLLGLLGVSGGFLFSFFAYLSSIFEGASGVVGMLLGLVDSFTNIVPSYVFFPLYGLLAIFVIYKLIESLTKKVDVEVWIAKQ